jgi:hypothetical protein
MPFQYEQYVDAQDGLSVVLTIDEVIQHYLEKNLETARIENKLTGSAMGVVMDPKTGRFSPWRPKRTTTPIPHSPFWTRRRTPESPP